MTRAPILFLFAFGLSLCDAGSTDTGTPGPGHSTSTPDPESVSQIESITCDVSGNIYVHMKSGSWVQHISTDCGNSSHVARTSPNFTITGCTKDTGVELTMSEEDNGKHITRKKLQKQTITCTSITKAVNRTPSLNIGEESIVIATPKTITETIELHMELFSMTTSAKKVSDINIGEHYTIRIYGAGNHSMNVKSCDVSADDQFNNPVRVYSKGDRSEDSVLQPFNTSTAANGSVSLRSILTGFRLIGSNTVYMKCTVTVCPTSTSCASRKRKGRKHQPTEREALLRFQVRDSTMRASDINGTEKTAINNTMTLLVLFIARYFCK